MYHIVRVEDDISVPPSKFDLPVEEAVKESISEKFEGMIKNDIGVILSVVTVEEIGDGKVLPEDGSVHYPVVFKLLTWLPKEQEVVEGEVVDITEFGAFIRIGPVDGLVHISQVMDDFVSYDEKNSQLTGKTSKKVLKEGDAVRARIISVSLKEQNKVGLTMRQPNLGALRWLNKG
ncbi:MAG: DNA-directed RNA polymerase [Candidatus Micrarchaeota archaeon]|nr:DNA-directed RNA polymerase [Candidatus Micrarchaeota archaeon]